MRVRLVRALGVAAALAVTGVVAAAVPVVAATPSENVANLPVDFWQSCWPDATTPGCYDAVLADINYARSLEGVAPMVLPTHYAELDPAQQAFVVTNLERVDRGLRPVAGLTADLNTLATVAAAAWTDPVFTGSSVGPLAGTWWTGIWADTPNSLIADLLWMYQDGWGGADTTNVDCKTADSAGCWGHRDNILSDYAGADQIVAGAGWAPTWGQSVSLVAVGGHGALPPLTFTWAQAIADGAGGPAALAAWQALTASASSTQAATTRPGARTTSLQRSTSPRDKKAAAHHAKKKSRHHKVRHKKRLHPARRAQ